MSFKDLGNEEYKSGNWLKAAAMYTKGIKEDPDNAVLYRWDDHLPCISWSLRAYTSKTLNQHPVLQQSLGGPAAA